MNHALPEIGTRDKGRIRLTARWLPASAQRLLDVGCAYGYGTRAFAERVPECHGIDPNPELIEVARARYPQLHFDCARIEESDLPAESFDVVVANEVLEHVDEELRALDEMHRLLRRGGTLILTVPHAGLLEPLDPDNLRLALKGRLPALYRGLLEWGGRAPDDPDPPGFRRRHRHYTLAQVVALLDASRFGEGYAIRRVFRSGLGLSTFCRAASLALELRITARRAYRVLTPLRQLAQLDYWIPLGRLSYNLALALEKLS